MKHFVSKVYTDVNQNKPTKYWDFEKLEIKWNSSEPYELVKRIGRGKYSEVFQAIDTFRGSTVVLKVLKPVRSKKIKREIKILQNLCGGPNVIRLIDTVMNPHSEYPTLVMEYMPTIEFSKVFSTFTVDDIRFYMMELLKVLDFCHSMGIMHRDLKPQNTLINHKDRRLVLIDWGLAEFYHPDTAYNVRVASKCYKGPELLINFQKYDYSLDMWSLGCMFASMLFLKEPFFHGKDDSEQLFLITEALGYDDLIAYAAFADCCLPDKLCNTVVNCDKKPWSVYVDGKNKHLCSDVAFNLLEKLLVFNHTKRLTAKEAMNHEFFGKIANS